MTEHPSEQVLVRMPADMHRALKQRAASEERSMAAQVRLLVRQWLAAGAPGEEQP